MIPVVLALVGAKGVESKLCVTAQHREMLDQVLDIFDIKPDFDLNLMKPGQDLTDITADVLTGLRGIFEKWRPDMVLVHGDTTTAAAAAISAYYHRIAVAHVEAGLRTGNKYAPWPEEINRRLVGTIASTHFAPTAGARENLLKEGVSEKTIHVTGNTVIDSLLMVKDKLLSDWETAASLKRQFDFIDASKKLILVTGHRRENFGAGFEEICHALSELAERRDVEIIYPVHLNPNVLQPVRKILSGKENIHLIRPIDYMPFVYLMDRADIIITDSGGIQEEAPSLGKPVLVMRDVTERPEAVEAGTVKLVGANRVRIVAEALRLLDCRDQYELMSRAHNPYGDGKAAERIVELLRCLRNEQGTVIS